MRPIPALSIILVLPACAPAISPTAATAPTTAPTPITGSPTASVTRGALFAEANCSSCHALGSTGVSPLPAAPPLREISHRYPVEQLGEAFAEGFVSTHSPMPEFMLEAGENRDLLAYLASIQSPLVPE